VSVDESLSLEDISYRTPTAKNVLNNTSSSTPYSLPHAKFGYYKPMEWTIEVK